MCIDASKINNNGVFPKWIRSMNWAKFKDLLCYLCLAGAVVASLTQVVAGSNNLFKTIIFATEFSENI